MASLGHAERLAGMGGSSQGAEGLRVGERRFKQFEGTGWPGVVFGVLWGVAPYIDRARTGVVAQGKQKEPVIWRRPLN